MKNNRLLKLELLKSSLIGWILGGILAFPIMFFLDYFTGRIYPPKMDDIMRYAQTQQLRLELIILSLFNAILPGVINAIEIFFTDMMQNGDKRETKRSYFNFSFDLAGIKRPIPYMFAVTLIVAEESFIISMMIFLKQNYYTALNNSVELFLGFPGPLFIVAGSLLMIDYFLIFCILLFSFLWGYSWVQWVSDTVFPRFSGAKYFSETLLLVSLVFRAINMLGLAFVINFMVAYSGNFITTVKIISGMTILLFLWIGIYGVPYLREKALLRAKKVA